MWVIEVEVRKGHKCFLFRQCGVGLSFLQRSKLPCSYFYTLAYYLATANFVAKLKVETNPSDFFLQAPIHDQHQMRSQVVQSLCPARCRRVDIKNSLSSFGLHTENPPSAQFEIHSISFKLNI